MFTSMTNPVTPQPTVLPRVRQWQIHAVSLLLLLQAIGILGISLYLFSRVDWDLEWSDVTLSATALEIASFLFFFVPLAVMLIFAAIGFFFLWRAAWLMAMIEQGLSLFGCLAIYFTFESALNNSNFIYLLMFYSILMVLYLNNNDVRISFQTKPTLADVEPTGEIDPIPTDERADERPND